MKFKTFLFILTLNQQFTNGTFTKKKSKLTLKRKPIIQKQESFQILRFDKLSETK